jgi:RNA polymerase sigma-70 factor (ECF subfamily)
MWGPTSARTSRCRSEPAKPHHVLTAGDAYRALAPHVLAYLRAQRVGDPEDILGEVFLQVARDIKRFEGDAAGLRRWVFAIAHNRVLDARRRQARRPQISHGDVPERSDGTPLPEALDPVLLAALASLTADQREVVLLRFVADLSLEDVAKLTKRNVGAVKALQHRGLENLGRILPSADGAV